MSSKRNTKENTSKKKHKHRKNKHYTVLPYIKYAVSYILISMIVFVPLSIGIMSSAVSTVHKAQEVMTKGANELVLDNSFEKCNYSEYLDKISVGKRLGTVSCESVGICENVYYGINRACLRSGVGLSQSSYIFGEGGCSRVAGYPSSSFRRLSEISIGDEIFVDTFWGSFRYEVVSIDSSFDYEAPETDSLLLAVQSGNEPFSAQSGEMIYVTAVLTSKEVM